MLVGKILCKAKSTFGSWNDGQFEKRIGVLQEPGDNSMTAFMIGYSFSGLGCDELRFFFYSADDALSCEFKVNDGDEFFAVTSCDDCGLVADIFDIGSAEARSQGSQPSSIFLQINFLIKDERFQMYLENFSSSF